MASVESCGERWSPTSSSLRSQSPCTCHASCADSMKGLSEASLMASEPTRRVAIPGPMHLAQLAGQAAMAEAESWLRGIPGHRFGVFGRALGARALIGGQALQGG